MSKYIKLTPEQKEELRRLTQLANRRVRQAQKVYQKEGKRILPLEIVGRKELQVKEGWYTEKNPISRSIKFESRKAYNEQMNFLRTFENYRPNMREFTQAQRTKATYAVETALGRDVPDEVAKKLEAMTAPQIADFWANFEAKSRAMGTRYSSQGSMEQNLYEFFPEDMGFLLGTPNKAEDRGQGQKGG